MNRNIINSIYEIIDDNTRVQEVLNLIEQGGREVVFDQDRFGWNLLQYACKSNVSIEIVSKIIEVGGRNVVFWRKTDLVTIRFIMHVDTMCLLILWIF